LPPGVEPIFAQLGVTNAIEAAGFIRHRGTWVTWSGPRRFDRFGGDRGGPGLGFQAPRDRLDAILLQAAAEAGFVSVSNQASFMKIATARPREARPYGFGS
jgi:2-polyprenyl-6-methoxyphenol hydroxylase-like FAD-dependent oxidoreductase